LGGEGQLKQRTGKLRGTLLTGTVSCQVIMKKPSRLAGKALQILSAYAKASANEGGGDRNTIEPLVSLLAFIHSIKPT